MTKKKNMIGNGRTCQEERQIFLPKLQTETMLEIAIATVINIIQLLGESHSQNVRIVGSNNGSYITGIACIVELERRRFVSCIMHKSDSWVAMDISFTMGTVNTHHTIQDA